MEEALTSLADEELLQEYEEQLVEYTQWVDKEVELNQDWIEEVEYLVFTRNFIHEILQEVKKRDLSIDTSVLGNLDLRWQEWCMAHTSKGFELETKYGKGRKFWWTWIHELSQLSEEEKRNL